MTTQPFDNDNPFADLSSNPQLDAALDRSMTSDAAEGRKPLPQEGNYPNCRVLNIEPFVTERDGKEVIRMRVTLACDDDDENTLTPYITDYGANPSAKSKHYQFFRAVFGGSEALKEAADKGQATWRNAIGKRTDVMVMHQQTNTGQPYADYVFTAPRT